MSQTSYPGGGGDRWTRGAPPADAIRGRQGLVLARGPTALRLVPVPSAGHGSGRARGSARARRVSGQERDLHRPVSAGGGGVHGLRPVGLTGAGRLQQRGDGPVVLDADAPRVRGELSVVPRRAADDGAGADLGDHLPGAARGAAASCMSTPRICTSMCTATSRRRRTLLQPEGIVSFDDFRAEHCPGVSAAVWGAVATIGPEADRASRARSCTARGATRRRCGRRCWRGWRRVRTCGTAWRRWRAAR